MPRTLLGESAPIKNLISLIDRVAVTKTNVLIIGESGTGKELVARTIHESGPLKNSPFIPVNCGAIPENLIETEMFGHHKGSFTGAINEKTGLFEAANKGTLFLDEVGELSLVMQVKLLRAIQERVFRKVGGIEDIQVDVRIIAATNRDLEEAVNKGTFREDLYYRLNVILIRTPPLRDRKGDVRLLAEVFLKKFIERTQKQIHAFDPRVIAALEAYRWPGNVRELENVVERAVTLETNAIIGLESLPIAVQQSLQQTRAEGSSFWQSEPSTRTPEIRLPSPDFSQGNLNLDEILGNVERVFLSAALKHAGGIKKKAAALLGITFRSMRYRLAKLRMGREFDSPDSNSDE